MTLDDDIAVLSQAPLLHLLDRGALRLLAFAADHRTLRAGDVLFRKGDRSDGGYVVARGAVALDPDEGSPATFVAGPGALIGRTALFTPVARPAIATAREPSSVLHISPSLMRRVLEEFPTAAAAIQAVIAEELAQLTDGLERVRRHLLAIDGEEGTPRLTDIMGEDETPRLPDMGGEDEGEEGTPRLADTGGEDQAPRPADT